MPVGDPPGGLARQVDPGAATEAEVLRLLDERVLGLDVGLVRAVLLPEPEPDAVEERVAGELQRLVEADEPVRRRLVVLEPAVAHLEPRRAVEAVGGAEAVVEGADAHDRLPGRARRELALGGPAEQGQPAFSSYSASSCFWETPPTQTSGSYVGWLAIATIRPVLASMTIAAPLSAT